MPTAAEFDLAAGRFARAAGRAADVVGPVVGAMGPHVMAGGALTDAVETFVEHSAAKAASIALQLDQLSGDAAQRADQVREHQRLAEQYERDVRAHRNADAAWRTEKARFDADPTTNPWPGPPPAPPQAPPDPPDWAEF